MSSIILFCLPIYEYNSFGLGLSREIGGLFHSFYPGRKNLAGKPGGTKFLVRTATKFGLKGFFGIEVQRSTSQIETTKAPRSRRITLPVAGLLPGPFLILGAFVSWWLATRISVFYDGRPPWAMISRAPPGLESPSRVDSHR